MNPQDASDNNRSAQPGEQGFEPCAGSPGVALAPNGETSQAERAAMHPEQQDLEWRYYCHAWSN